MPTKTEGGKKEVWVEDQDAISLLQDILRERKRMNSHLMILTDTVVGHEDIDLDT